MYSSVTDAPVINRSESSIGDNFNINRYMINKENNTQIYKSNVSVGHRPKTTHNCHTSKQAHHIGQSIRDKLYSKTKLRISQTGGLSKVMFIILTSFKK